MASKKQSPSEKAAVDPSVISGRRANVPEYPEGTHPPVPPSEQTWGPDRFSYSDAPADLKPDESSNVQTVEDPMDDANQDALQKGADEGAAARAKEARDK